MKFQLLSKYQKPVKWRTYFFVNFFWKERGLAILLVHCLKRKIVTGAGGVVDVYFLVPGEAVFFLEDELFEQAHQLVESGKLFGRGFASLEIAHETNAYSSVID